MSNSFTNNSIISAPKLPGFLSMLGKEVHRIVGHSPLSVYKRDVVLWSTLLSVPRWCFRVSFPLSWGVLPSFSSEESTQRKISMTMFSLKLTRFTSFGLCFSFYILEWIYIWDKNFCSLLYFYLLFCHH